MKFWISLTALILIFIASTAMAGRFPSKTEVVKAEISCRTQKYPNSPLRMDTVTTLDHKSSLELLSFLETINDHWKLWGFFTTPAGDIQINFLLSNKSSVLIQTSFDLERIWTDAGYRVLSNNERKYFQKLLPSNAQQKRSN